VPLAQVRRPFAPATREAEVRLPKTDALVGALVQMAPKAVKHFRAGSLILTFRTGLKTERPVRGFTVRVSARGNQILFHVPYAVLAPEHAQLAIDEMTDWIHKKLGADLEVTSVPSRPGQ